MAPIDLDVLIERPPKGPLDELDDPFIRIGQSATFGVDRLGERIVQYSDGPWLHGGDSGKVIEYHPDPLNDPDDDYATVLVTARDGRTQRLAISPNYAEHGNWLIHDVGCDCDSCTKS